MHFHGKHYYWSSARIHFGPPALQYFYQRFVSVFKKRNLRHLVCLWKHADNAEEFKFKDIAVKNVTLEILSKY